MNQHLISSNIFEYYRRWNNTQTEWQMRRPHISFILCTSSST